MIRMEGEARLFGFVGLVWSLVNSSYIHINEFGNRNAASGPSGPTPTLRPVSLQALRAGSGPGGNVRKDNIRLFTINSGSNLALLAAFQ